MNLRTRDRIESALGLLAYTAVAALLITFTAACVGVLAGMAVGLIGFM